MASVRKRVWKTATGEMRTVYTGMGSQQQLELTRACVSNQDTRFADLCSAVGTF